MPGMETQNQPPDLALQLPRDIYYLVVYTLRGMLPPPETDTPEAEARRDRAAIALVASMLPANGEEAHLAARSVGFAIYAMDCLRQARDFRGDPPFFLKCNAQAVSTERKAQSARSLLLRLQAERRKREADNATADKAAWSEHCAIGLMADALGHASPAATPEPPPPPPDPQPPEEPVSDPVAEADQYAVIYPQRAARIRALGGLPQPCDFGPPPPELVDAIVTGTSPTLCALLVSPTGTRDIDEIPAAGPSSRSEHRVGVS
jgi:hypothetical protein